MIILSYFAPSLHIFLRWILILSSHLRLGRATGLFPSGFPTKILYIFLISPMRGTCLANLILFHLITLIISCEGEAPHYAVFSTLLPHPPAYVQKFSQQPAVLVWQNQVSHSYKTTGKLCFLCILNFKVLDRRRKTALTTLSCYTVYESVSKSFQT